MRFFLLWADVADEVGIGYFTTSGDLGLFDDEKCSGAGDSFGERTILADAVRE
jgi:hypothetical protein